MLKVRKFYNKCFGFELCSKGKIKSTYLTEKI